MVSLTDDKAGSIAVIWKLKGSKEGQYKVWPKHPYSPEVHFKIVQKYGDDLEALYDREGKEVTL